MRSILIFFALAPALAWCQIDLQLTQVSDLRGVVDIKHAGDGSGRLFLLRQAGEIRILDGGILLDTPFLSIRERIVLGNEQGLLSLAFSPDFNTRPRFYVYYTDTVGRGVIARYRVSEDDPNVAAPDSEEILLRVDQPFPNHNGGRLEFGPDGMLYFGFGDGGGGGDPGENAQDPRTLLGKLIRIDVSGNGDYVVPPDNPFVNDPGTRDEIWALGLRNPWRIAFDRMTGELYIADVGQNTVEEINIQPAGVGGQNYGWDIFEGTRCFEGDCDSASGLTPPVFEYGHDLGCSITGGQVYRGLDYPALQGLYLYGDFCGGQIWGLRVDGAAVQNTLLLESGLGITTFGEDEVGNVYVGAGGRGVFLVSDGEPASASRPIVGQHTGTYIVDGLPDQGFFVTVDENASGPFLFFAWFTYLDGEPFWLVGNEFFIDGDASVVVDVQRLEGPGFLDFSAEPADRTVFGTMSFTALGCDEFQVDYDFGAQGTGSLRLQRLTGVKGFDCEP